MPNVDGGSLWELVERRAEATPDGLAAVDEDGRTLTWAEARTGGRAGRGRAGPPRDRRGRRRVVAAADVAREQGRSCSRWPASAPSRTRCSRSTASARSASSPGRRRASCSSCRRPGPASTSRRWPRASRPRSRPSGGSLEVLVADKALPQGDPSDAPAAARTRAQDAGALVLLHVGHHGRPEGRAAHRPHDPRQRAGHERAGSRSPTGDRNAVVFPFTHIGGIGWLFSALAVGFPTVYIERFDPAKTIALIQEHEVTMAGAGTPFHMAYLAAQRQLPEGEALFPSVRVYCGGGAPKPPQLHYDIKAEMGGVGIVSGYGLTEAPIIVDGHRRRHRRAARPHRGQGHRHDAAAGGHARGQGSRHRRGGRDPRQGPAADEGLPRLVARRRGLRRGRLVPHRRPRPHRRRRHGHHHRSGEGHHHPQHGEHLRQGGGGPALRAPRHRRRRRHRPARSEDRRAGVRGGRARRTRTAPIALRRAGRLRAGAGADDAEAARAARDRRRAPAQPHRQGPQVRAPRPLRRLQKGIPPPMALLTGKVAIVTGAGHGIGRAPRPRAGQARRPRRRQRPRHVGHRRRRRREGRRPHRRADHPARRHRRRELRRRVRLRGRRPPRRAGRRHLRPPRRAGEQRRHRARRRHLEHDRGRLRLRAQGAPQGQLGPVPPRRPALARARQGRGGASPAA